MSLTKRLFVFAGAALSLSTAAMAQSTTLDQSRSYASDLMADASTRTSSLAPAAQDFTVNVHGYTQFRYNMTWRDDSGLDDNTAVGFQNARTDVNLSGNIGNENWGYFVQWQFSDNESDGGGSASLNDAYGTYKMGNGWAVRFGQFKLPLFRAELIGDTYQLFVDRWVGNTFYSQGRSQGIQASYEGDQFRFAMAFSDGIRTANTDYESPIEADYAFTGRGEFKWAGDWKQSRDFTSFRNSDFFGMIGAAGHYQSGGDTVGTSDVSFWALTADVSIEGNGWNAFAAFYWNDTDPEVGDSFQDFGIQAQGGIFVSESWELALGWSVLIPDTDRTGDDVFNTIQLGANYYFIPESHAVKGSIDFLYFVDKQSTCDIAIPNSLTGLLATGEDSEWTLRAQIQLMF